MGFAKKITTSLHGRVVGIQSLSSAESGSGSGVQHFLAGQFADIRRDVSTAETTAVNLKAHGVSQFGTTSTGTGSSAVYTLDPPIPGVTKFIAMTCGASDGPIYIKTGGPTIESTAGSTFQTIKMSTRQFIELIGVTTGRWMTFLSSAQVVLQETT
jgi:hypothetical protein